MLEMNPTGARCLALGENGCRIPREMRPGQCLSFPWILNMEDLGFHRSIRCPHLGAFKKEPDCEQWKGLAITALITAKMATIAAIVMRKEFQAVQP